MEIGSSAKMRLCAWSFLLSAAVTSGCGSLFGPSQPAVKAWVADEMVNLTDRMPPQRSELFDVDAQTVRLFAAANETVSFQLVLDGDELPAEGVRVAFTALTDEQGRQIAPEQFLAFRMWPVRVERFPAWYLRLADAVPEPANFYDALVPVDAPKNGQPFRIVPGERLALWVDLQVPRTTAAGRYAGRVTISAADRQDRTFRVEAQVYEFVLPDARPLATVGGFDHATLFGRLIERDGKPFVPAQLDRRNPLVRRGLTAMRQLMVLAHEHRLDLFDRRIRPLMKRDMFGKVRLDWEDYDAIVQPYLRGTAFEDRVGCPAWPMPFAADWPDPAYYGGDRTEAYLNTCGEVIDQCARHFAADRELSERMFHWPCRGWAASDSYERHAHLARLIRAVDANTPILSELPPNPPKLTGWQPPQDFARLVDIAAPRAEWFDPACGIRAQPERPLTGPWLSPGLPPYLGSLGIIATPADVRAIPWFAMKYRCTGLFLPEVMHWQGDVFATDADAETRLFYPGTIAGIEGVLPSARLKRLRRGLQDIAYLWLIQQRQRPGIAQAILDAVTRYAGMEAVGDNYLDPRLNGWVQRADTWHLARRLLAEEVQALVHPSEVSNQTLLAQRLAWRKLDAQAHTVRVEQVRSRVTPVEVRGPDGKVVETRLRATVLLDLYNEYAREVDCQVKFETLPAGWKPVAQAARISPFPPATRRTVTLLAEGDNVPSDAAGKLALPVSMTVDMTDRQEFVARVPFLLAGQAASQPPVIDGKLEDWPMRLGNSAGAFKLIGRRGERGEGLATRQTLAFVLYDETNLYVAFRCEEPRLDLTVAQPTNIIHYEQLMACGEDLVEVILDPGADAAGPEDLYHIAVKSNGVLLAERGVHTSPPLGKAEAWPVAASVALGRQKDVWIVELAIPRSAFGAEGRAAFWGVNFTRFATQGCEAASWAGAPRYFYDPKNLGTMFVTPGGSPAR